MQVALYARVSTERQEQQGTIASQLDALTRWAREQHHDVVDASARHGDHHPTVRG